MLDPHSCVKGKRKCFAHRSSLDKFLKEILKGERELVYYIVDHMRERERERERD